MEAKYFMKSSLTRIRTIGTYTPVLLMMESRFSEAITMRWLVNMLLSREQ